MARVDNLPEGVKEVLQTGSVIEREFSYKLIMKVTDVSQEELLSNLSTLKDLELIYERGIFPQSNYIFKHALTREVVYDSILTRKKKDLHEDIGNAIEELYKDSIDEHYGILTEHYIESENYEKGAEYCRLAARRAEKAASLSEAITYGEKSVACLEKLPRTESVEKKIIDARTILGFYLNQMNYHIDAKEVVEPVVELALERDRKRRVSQIYTIMGSYYYNIEEDFHKAFKHLEDGLKIAEELNDVFSLVMANYWLAIALAHNREFEKSFHCLKKALNIYVDVNSLWGMAMMKGNISNYIYSFQGKVDLGYQTSKEALGLAEESGDIFSKTHVYCFHGVSCYFKRFLKEAEEYLSKAIDYSGKINAFILSGGAHWFLGEVYLDMGEYQESQVHYEKAIVHMEHVSMWPSVINLCKTALTKAKVMLNKKDINLESLYAYVHENRLKLYESWIINHIGEILLNIDDQHLSESEEWIKKAIEVDKNNGMKFHLGRDYALYAELFKRKGNPSKAKETLSKAIEIMNECGADGWVEKYEKELATLS
jgi:tetratricopeptide (TPR) repeat protein